MSINNNYQGESIRKGILLSLIILPFTLTVLFCHLCGFEHELNLKRKDTKTEIEVCGNSNIRNLTEEDRRIGRSHRCSTDDPCKYCLNNKDTKTEKEDTK